MNKKLLLCLLALVMGSVTAIAQQKSKFSIISFGLNQFDATATMPQYEKFDTNNARYAIIKVTSTNPDDDLRGYNFDFANCKAIPVPQKDGSLWVYVQRMARTVTITREGYVPMRHHDLGETIEAGRVYNMVFSSEDPIIHTQMVHFTVVPASSRAIVMIQRGGAGAPEEYLGEIDTGGSLARPLEYGTYNYKVIADNYHSSQGQFILNDKSKTLVEKVMLRANFAEITLSVDADADIYVGGEFKGRRFWSGVLKSGAYQVECHQENHRVSTQSIVVRENENQSIVLAAPQPIYGTLSIASVPSGASITIDGKDYGVTPKNVEVVIGSHKVVLSKDGYGHTTKSVEVRERQTTFESIKLEQTSKFTISSSPSHARLYIDGVYRGETTETIEMPIGEHKIELYYDKHKPVKKTEHFKATKTNYHYKLPRMLVREKNMYIELFGQAGMTTGFGANIGFYVNKFNLEATGTHYMFDETVCHGEGHGAVYYGPYTQSLSAYSYGGKVGLGFIVGPRVRLTPQVGAVLLNIEGNGMSSLSTTNICMTIGARMEVAFSSHFGMSLTPEYQMPITNTDTSDALETVSSKVKNLLSGFNGKLGFYLCF